MGNGEDSGTWGSITNINWNLMEQAIAGVQTITMSNANYTLTNLNGVSDESRNMVLVISGTNSAIRQVVAPLAPKFYVVSNQTVGGNAITIGGVSGSLITVPSGTTVQVYCDGTNFFSAQTSSAGNFNINGNLTVNGTSTLTGLLTANGGVSSTTGNFSGNLASLGSVSGATGVFGAVSGTTGSFSSTVSGTTITASTQFSGPGTGLTGTASSLSIGGNAATATNATNATTAASCSGNSATATLASTANTLNSFDSAVTIRYGFANSKLSVLVNSTNYGNTFPVDISGNSGTATNPQSGGSFITSSNIGSQSVAFATNSGQFQSKTKLGLGITGEVWNNNTGSKAFNTSYTNTSNYPVQICVTLSCGGTAQSIIGIVNNSQIIVDADNNFASISFIVPALTQYQVNCATQSTSYIWQELY
jgi:hypothetical protein